MIYLSSMLGFDEKGGKVDAGIVGIIVVHGAVSSWERVKRWSCGGEICLIINLV